MGAQVGYNYIRGEFLDEPVPRFEQALEAIDASLAAAPERIESLLLRAKLLLRLERHEQARLALLRVLELDPEHPGAWGLLRRLSRQRYVQPS